MCMPRPERIANEIFVPEADPMLNCFPFILLLLSFLVWLPTVHHIQTLCVLFCMGQKEVIHRRRTMT